MRESPLVDVRGVVENTVNSGARIITSRAELDALDGGLNKGIAIAAVRDLMHSKAALAGIAGRYAARKVIGRQTGLRKNPQKDESAVLVAPGYFGHNDYMAELAYELDWPALWHQYFDGLRLRGRILSNAKNFFNLLEAREASTVGLAHSRGGPTMLNTLAMLQDAGLDDRMEALVLVSPISAGIRDSVARASRILPSNTISEMRPGSGVLNAWQRLTPENRAKVVVINGLHGDQFTTLERGYVDGGTGVVTAGHDGHIQQVVDRRCETFGITRNVINAVIAEIERR